MEVSKYPSEGRFEPYDFETFSKYSSRLTKYSFQPEQTSVKIYYKKDKKLFFVSLYNNSGGFHSCTINKRQFERLKLISSKKYHLCEQNKSELNGSDLKYYDFYLEWTFSEYFSQLVESITISFLVNLFEDYDFIDHLILSKRAEIYMSNYIYDLIEKYKKELTNLSKKNTKNIMTTILSKEYTNILPIFWTPFKNIGLKYSQNIKINQKQTKIMLIKYMLELKIEMIEEIESKKYINAYMSKIYAYGPNSATSKICKKDFESFL